MTPQLHLGALLFPQHTTWEALREHALLVDELGYDSLWTWDHFIPIAGGDATGRYFEGWQLIAAWGALTRRVRIGTLVTGVTYRNPGVLAKMVVTLDHITGGRAILGLGAAWNEREHNMYGIPFDDWTTRFQKLDEACAIIRSLLREPATTFHGRQYRFRDALAEPKPVQPHLPLLIGGGGEKKTLRITAKYADYWHGFGTPEEIGHKLEVLRAHCAKLGRDYAEITPISGLNPGATIRDEPDDVQTWLRTVARTQKMGPDSALLKERRLRTVDEVVERMLQYVKVGVRGFIIGFAPPYDRETMERIAGEVRPRIEREVAALV